MFIPLMDIQKSPPHTKTNKFYTKKAVGYYLFYQQIQLFLNLLIHKPLRYQKKCFYCIYELFNGALPCQQCAIAHMCAVQVCTKTHKKINNCHLRHHRPYVAKGEKVVIKHKSIDTLLQKN